MRIAVDAHAIGRRLTGNEVYIRSLLGVFAGQASDCDFIAYVSSDAAAAAIPRNIAVRRVAANPFVRLGWDLPRQAAPGPARSAARAIYRALCSAGCRWWSACMTSVFLNILSISRARAPFNCGPPWDARCGSAAKILTCSEFSRRSILKVYGDLDEDKVVVASNAAPPRVSARFRARRRPRYVRDTLKIPGPFVLSVGDLQPRKNQIGLIHAFARLVRAHPQLKHRLVLAGKETWFASRVHDAARESGVADRIQFLRVRFRQRSAAAL